jgi:hypothetical protein
MELPGSGYLYALATISITYAGFAVLVTVFRQTIGGTLSGHDVFFIRSVLARSFMIAGFAMLPPLLALFELTPSTIWRSSSAVAAILQGLFILTWPARRRAVTDKPLPRSSVANNVFQLLTAIFLLMNALGIFFEPAAGPFAASVTAFMMSAAISYMIALGILLQAPQKKKRR